MENLNSKTKGASTLILAITSAIFWIFTPTRISQGLIALVGVLSALALFLAIMKNRQWSQIAWIWTAFFLPYLLGQIILLDYIVQNVIVRWLIPILLIYLSILPIVLIIMYIHLYLVAQQL